jgi:RNA polymerase sigma-70 factor (ECF subfamily)
VQAATVCEGFLREALLSSKLTQPSSKRQKNLLHLGQSGDTIRNRLQTERRQTKSKHLSTILRAHGAGQKKGLNLDTTATSPKLLGPSEREHQTWTSRRALNDVDTPPQPTDEVLLKCLQEGDKEAFVYLFRRYAQTLHGIGRKILRDTTEAEDLVQEVFIYVHRKCGLYDSSKGTARSWILQIAYTQAFIRRRRLKSLGFYASGIADTVREPAVRNTSQPEYDQSPEGLFGRNGWKRVAKSLTEDQRETLRLHFFEGYTFAEIAEKLGQSFANVRNHHYRGLEKLRKYLAVSELSGR